MENIIERLIMVLAIASAILHSNITWAQEKPEITLRVGDPAPPIAYAKWIKGTPIKELEEGKVYVLEFWATWCGPCRAAMPHLSELANKYKGKATVISFNVQELAHRKEGLAGYKEIDYVGKAERFVKAAGNIMDYNVAVDVPEETMWKTWVTASGGGGIPYALIVDRNRKIAWIGSVGGMDRVLELILTGNYNPGTENPVRGQSQNRDKYRETLAKYNAVKSAKIKDYKQEVEMLNELLRMGSGFENFLKQWKYSALAHIEPIQASALANEFINEYQKNAVALASLTEAIFELQDSAGIRTDIPLALKAMKVAYERSDKEGDANIIKLLAAAYYRNGDVKKAVELQEKATAIIVKGEFVDYGEDFRNENRQLLTDYKSALKQMH